MGKVNMFSDLKYAKCIHCIPFKLDALLNLIPADGKWLLVSVLSQKVKWVSVSVGAMSLWSNYGK